MFAAPVGQSFIDLCGKTRDMLTGRLRVDMSVMMATKLVLPRLGEFMARHPQLAIDLGTADRRVDLICEGYDCVLRAGALTDSTLVARPLGDYRQVNCASPAYLAQYGTPQRLEDLVGHRLIHYDAQLGGSARPGNGSTASIRITRWWAAR
jgi:DNA-binding transcriptional LysR family regulator